MQQELDAMDLDLPIQILGVNEVGFDGANETACDGRDIPWLQEASGSLIWDPWQVIYRDVIILGPDNHRVAVYNLTDNNLGDSDKYERLKSLLVDAATAP